MYDVVFKKLMGNEKVAKFFIETLLEQHIESIELKPQEFAFIKGIAPDDEEGIRYAKERLQERLAINVYRLDFLATIKTETGEYKKVLIEIQKAKNQFDLMWFRDYLTEQYKKENMVNNETMMLPKTTIYILGFKLPEIETPCIRVQHEYFDLTNKTTLTTRSEIVDKLNDDCIVIQVNRITDRYQTTLDQLLSIFEQRHYTDSKEITKSYKHSTDHEVLKTKTDILHYVGTEPEERKQIENEQEGLRTLNAYFKETERKLQEDIKKKKEALKEKDQALSQKDKVINEKDKLIEELKRRLSGQ